MSALQPERLYMPGQVAEKFGVARATASRWLSSGKFPQDQVIVTPGGHHRVKADYIDALLRGEQS